MPLLLYPVPPNWGIPDTKVVILRHFIYKVSRWGRWGGRERGRECYHRAASSLPHHQSQAHPGGTHQTSTGLTHHGTESCDRLSS